MMPLSPCILLRSRGSAMLLALYCTAADDNETYISSSLGGPISVVVGDLEGGGGAGGGCSNVFEPAFSGAGRPAPDAFN